VIYHLDTNAVIAVLNNRPAAVREKLGHALEVQKAQVAVSSIVLYELWYGVARSVQRAENSERIRIFLAGAVDIAAFNENDAAQAGAIRGILEANDTPIGPYDLLIAAQALLAKATLVTANCSEFARVPGLAWQDWTA
jgi:tRNA(fMet)-specific endonuclease VapC